MNYQRSLIGLLCCFAVIYAIINGRLEYYGLRYNTFREKNNIPLINNTWLKEKEILSGKLIYINHNVKGKRFHLRKTIEVNFISGIETEYDYYIIDSAVIDAIYYYKKPTDNWHIRYYDLNGDMRLLYPRQFVDTLAKYKL